MTEKELNSYEILMDIFKENKLSKVVEELKKKLQEFFPNASEDELSEMISRVFDELLRKIEEEMKNHPEAGKLNIEKMVEYHFLTRYGIDVSSI